MQNLDLMMDRLHALPADRPLDRLEFAVWEKVSRGRASAISLWPSNLSFNVATALGALVIGLISGVYAPPQQAHAYSPFELVDQTDLVGGGLLQQAM